MRKKIRSAAKKRGLVIQRLDWVRPHTYGGEWIITIDDVTCCGGGLDVIRWVESLADVIIHPPKKKLNDVERFWSHVDIRRPDECWIWRKSKVYTPPKGTTKQAHVYVYTLVYGEIPYEYMPNLKKHVKRTCGENRCMNPAHMKLATLQERKAPKGRPGVLNSFSKISLNQAKHIRRMTEAGINQYRIAAKFHISQALVSDINVGRHWSLRPKQ